MKTIELPCEPHDSLDWSREIASATGEAIFWKFRLGLELPSYSLEDELRFEALSLALRQFSKEVWPQFQEKTFGLCLYRGPLPSEELSFYFQMLAHRLPDEAKIFLLFDLSNCLSLSDALTALNNPRYEHFTVAIRGKDLPREGYRYEEESIHYHSLDVKAGVVFTENFEEYFSKIDEPVKIVYENYLSEEWGGLDRLYVPKKLSPQGERMLKGFAAAGGEIIYTK